jgi:phage-related tail fiber protein
MSNYYNVLTNLGRAKITELITSQNEFKNIQIAFGDGAGSVPTPNPVRTSLVNEVHRRPADKLERHPTLTNNIIVDVVIPASVGSFWIREFGIYFDGVLICHGSLPPTYKEASEDSVNTYRLKPYINVESDRLNVVEVEGNLINATESWTEENFVKRSEIVDNLTTDDAKKVASARTVKELQDNKLEANDLKDASATQKGVVKLNNTLTSDAEDEAATAAQVKILNDQAFGVGQTWNNVTASRVLGTTYTNTTEKTIFVSFQVRDHSDQSNQVVNIYVDAIKIIDSAAFDGGTVWGCFSHSFPVPPGGTYSIQRTGNGTWIWMEFK